MVTRVSGRTEVHSLALGYLGSTSHEACLFVVPAGVVLADTKRLGIQ